MLTSFVITDMNDWYNAEMRRYAQEKPAAEYVSCPTSFLKIFYSCSVLNSVANAYLSIPHIDKFRDCLEKLYGFQHPRAAYVSENWINHLLERRKLRHFFYDYCAGHVIRAAEVTRNMKKLSGVPSSPAIYEKVIEGFGQLRLPKHAAQLFDHVQQRP